MTINKTKNFRVSNSQPIRGMMLRRSSIVGAFEWLESRDAHSLVLRGGGGGEAFGGSKITPLKSFIAVDLTATDGVSL